MTHLQSSRRQKKPRCLLCLGVPFTAPSTGIEVYRNEVFYKTVVLKQEVAAEWECPRPSPKGNYTLSVKLSLQQLITPDPVPGYTAQPRFGKGLQGRVWGSPVTSGAETKMKISQQAVLGSEEIRPELRLSHLGGQTQQGGGLQRQIHFPVGIYQTEPLQCSWTQPSKTQ